MVKNVHGVCTYVGQWKDVKLVTVRGINNVGLLRISKIIDLDQKKGVRSWLTSGFHAHHTNFKIGSKV